MSFTSDTGTRVVFRRGRCGLAEVFDFERTNQITARVIFSGGQIFAIVIFSVPLCHQRVGADLEFVQVRFADAERAPVCRSNRKFRD